MSATKSANGNAEVTASLELLAEYTEKLREYRERIASTTFFGKGSSQDSVETKKFVKYHIELFEDLDRFISQSIEHKTLHPLDRDNLILKLHEFERELEGARRIAMQ